MTQVITITLIFRYVVFRTIKDYYTGPPDEDAYDMRKALSRDKEKRSERPPTQEELEILEVEDG